MRSIYGLYVQIEASGGGREKKWQTKEFEMENSTAKSCWTKEMYMLNRSSRWNTWNTCAIMKHKDAKTKLKKSVFPRLFIISQMVAKGAYTEKDNDENKAQKKERERGWDRVTVKNRSLMVRFVLFAFSYTFEPIQLASGQGWNLIIMNNVVVVCFNFPYSLFSAPVFRWGVKGGRGEGIVFVTQSSLVMDVC